VRKLLLAIPARETTFRRRGFRRGEAAARQRLERVGQTFLSGYHAALETSGPARLAERLDREEAEFRGFAFEGAGMALRLLDVLTPWRGDRWQTFVRGVGAPHLYMAYVGAGWVLARLRQRVESPPAQADLLLRWLIVDGYGFHDGFFHWPLTIRGQQVPPRLTGYARRAFDQGLGRSLWFVEGADVPHVVGAVAAFPAARHADLWSGIGLACAYAGGACEKSLRDLRSWGGDHASHLAQGAAFAAKARQRAGNPADHTDMACQVFAGLSAERAAAVTDLALQDLPGDAAEPAFEVWRKRIREELQATTGGRNR
jgi:hypothetical protein